MRYFSKPYTITSKFKRNSLAYLIFQSHLHIWVIVVLLKSIISYIHLIVLRHCQGPDVKSYNWECSLIFSFTFSFLAHKRHRECAICFDLLISHFWGRNTQSYDQKWLNELILHHFTPFLWTWRQSHDQEWTSLFLLSFRCFQGHNKSYKSCYLLSLTLSKHWLN